MVVVGVASLVRSLYMSCIGVRTQVGYSSVFPNIPTSCHIHLAIGYLLRVVGTVQVD
jgi:hypothetical protein